MRKRYIKITVYDSCDYCLTKTIHLITHHLNSSFCLSLGKPALLPQGEVQVDERFEEDSFLCCWACVACHLQSSIIFCRFFLPEVKLCFYLVDIPVSSQMALWTFTTVGLVKDIVSCLDFHNTVVDMFSIL